MFFLYIFLVLFCQGCYVRHVSPQQSSLMVQKRKERGLISFLPKRVQKEMSEIFLPFRTLEKLLKMNIASRLKMKNKQAQLYQSKGMTLEEALERVNFEGRSYIQGLQDSLLGFEKVLRTYVKGDKNLTFFVLSMGIAHIHHELEKEKGAYPRSLKDDSIQELILE